jgi:lipid II:glycine glycyltransferase (peptidoglycan interpeptide bridge formation enzyme)
LSVFKRGFAGEDFAYLHAQDLVIQPLAYQVNLLVEKLRKKIRKV